MKVKSDMVKGFVHDSNFGRLKIVSYNGANDVDIEFLDTGYKINTRADSIRRGQVKDKVRPTIFGVGFIGDGDFKTFKSGKRTVEYEKWYHMLERCYSESHHKIHPTYKGCSVCDEWRNFQTFAKWLHSQDSDLKCTELDKDGLIVGNKVYSPDSCRLISKQENIEISQAKMYIVKSPAGDIISIFNMNRFCRENNLNRSNLRSVIKGLRKSHKGWTKGD